MPWKHRRREISELGKRLRKEAEAYERALISPKESEEGRVHEVIDLTLNRATSTASRISVSEIDNRGGYSLYETANMPTAEPMRQISPYRSNVQDTHTWKDRSPYRSNVQDTSGTDRSPYRSSVPDTDSRRDRSPYRSSVPDTDSRRDRSPYRSSVPDTDSRRDRSPYRSSVPDTDSRRDRRGEYSADYDYSGNAEDYDDDYYDQMETYTSRVKSYRSEPRDIYQDHRMRTHSREMSPVRYTETRRTYDYQVKYRENLVKRSREYHYNDHDYDTQHQKVRGHERMSSMSSVGSSRRYYTD